MGRNTVSCSFAILIGLLAGIGIGILYFFFGSVAWLPILIIGVVITAIILIALIFLFAFFSISRATWAWRCLTGYIGCIIAAIIGALVFGIVSLALLAVPGLGVTLPILIGFFTLFFTMLIILIIAYIWCTISGTDCESCRNGNNSR